MNLWDILILLAIAGIAVFAFLAARKRKASGKSSCCFITTHSIHMTSEFGSLCNDVIDNSEN